MTQLKIQRRVTHLRSLLKLYAKLQIYNFYTDLWKLQVLSLTEQTLLAAF
jgi:hypothetical protein